MRTLGRTPGGGVRITSEGAAAGGASPDNGSCDGSATSIGDGATRVAGAGLAGTPGGGPAAWRCCVVLAGSVTFDDWQPHTGSNIASENVATETRRKTAAQEGAVWRSKTECRKICIRRSPKPGPGRGGKAYRRHAGK